VIRLVCLLGIAACASTPAPARAQQLPRDAHLYDPGAAVFSPADRYRDHVVVLDFWASWCEECKRTAPQVDRMAAAFASDGLVVVGVNAGDSADEASTSARALGIHYPIALDPKLELAEQLGASDLPLFLVIDRDGTVVRRTKHIDPEMLDLLRKLLRAPRANVR